MASSGSTAWVAARRPADVRGEGGDQVAAALQRVGGGRVARGRVGERRGGRRRPRRARATRAGPRAGTPGSAPARPAPRAGRRAPGVMRQRDLARVARRARPAAAGSWSRSPPTATPRRTATSRSPRRRACGCAGRCESLHGRSTASRSSERSRPPRRSVKSRARDRRREAVVERLGDVQAPCARGPSRGARSRPGARAACARGRGRAGRRARSGARTARGTRPACTRARATGCRSARRPSGASVSTFGVET